MKGPAALDFIVDQLSPLGNITVKSMFGGHGVYCNGVMFALISKSVLYLKADEVNRPKFEELGIPPFQPFPDKPGVMQYYAAPPETFEDPASLRMWAGGAVQAAQRAAAQTRKATPRPPSKGRGGKPKGPKPVIRSNH